MFQIVLAQGRRSAKSGDEGINLAVTRLRVPLRAQPSDSLCGPTCLHAVYQYFDQPMGLSQVVAEVPELPDGGVLAVQLGLHALSRGFRATLLTNNLQTFDPTWFRPGVDLAERLRAQAKHKSSRKLQLATRGYLDFLKQGGQIRLEAFTERLLRSFIDRGLPIMAGLSATYLYDCSRELPDGTYDDVAGSPTGHFVVIRGYDTDTDHVLVADPLPEAALDPSSRADRPAKPPEGRFYRVELQRLLAAILLGIVTYDANLLVIEPDAGVRREPQPRE